MKWRRPGSDAGPFFVLILQLPDNAPQSFRVRRYRAVPE
jgi:hypothetical protein